MTERLEFHPIANIFPLMDGAEFEALAKDIATNGQRESIKLFEGKILDGRNRYRACIAAGEDAWFETWTGKDPVAYVISLNMSRRHLDESQRAMVAAKIATLDASARASGENSPPLRTAAKIMNVDRKTAGAARSVINHGTPELQAAVERGEVSVSAAAEVARLPEPEQINAVSGGKPAVAKAAKAARQKRNPDARTRQENWTAPSTSKESQHDRDLTFLHSAWDGACQSARAAFISGLGYEPLKGEAA